MEQDSMSPAVQSGRRTGRRVIVAATLALLVGLGTWVSSSVFNGSDGVTPADSELNASQHTVHLVRALRISAASDTTSSSIGSIPEAVHNIEPFECSSRFAMSLEDALVQLRGVDYLSTVGGARLSDAAQWRAQQGEAHDAAVALESLFPEECQPVTPVAFDLAEGVRFSDEISIQQMLRIADELVDEWTQLYLLAESAEERDVALAGLWQIIRWETEWEPGRSPFSFES